jgi:hypothetical protein
MDIVPESSGKLCDCPNLYFMTHDVKDYSNFCEPDSEKINNSLDSLIQAIDIAIHLGFRKLYLVGTDMIVRPSEAQIEYALSLGVEYDRQTSMTTVADVEENPRRKPFQSDLLSHFLEMVAKRGLMSQTDATAKLESLDREVQYAFDERKTFGAAMNSDKHYWDRVQYLRLSRRSLSRHGISLVSCTPQSRLNAFFRYQAVSEVARELRSLGTPYESTVGKYRTRKHINNLPYHQDIKPYRPPEKRPEKGKPKQQAPQQPTADVKPPPLPIQDLQKKLAALTVKTIIREDVE